MQSIRIIGYIVKSIENRVVFAAFFRLCYDKKFPQILTRFSIGSIINDFS